MAERKAENFRRWQKHNRGMDNSKQVNSSDDMISRLPDPILHSILSRIPATEEVIRTSILSTRWRYLWTPLSSIDIDITRRLNPHERFKNNKFDKFMFHILENTHPVLNSFRLHCGNYFTMLPVRRWIEAATMRNVKSLDLKFCLKYESINVPDCVMTCGSLEELRLHLFGCCLRFPDCNGFSVIRVLELDNVRLSNCGIVTDFLKNCPLLEELTLKNLEVLIRFPVDGMFRMGEIVNRDIQISHGRFGGYGMFRIGDISVSLNIQISCPKLVFLELEGDIGHYKCIGLDSLKKAVIKPDMPLSRLMVNNLHELFDGISRVESLSINPFVIIECIHASFPNLKTLELTTIIDEFPMDSLIQILKSHPHLEALHLIIKDVFSYKMRNTFGFAHEKLEEVETRRIFTRHLKKVEFLEFNGEHASLSMARLLLLYGDVLEEMGFSWDNKDKYPQKSMETMKIMSNFHKASSTVKLVTLLKEYVAKFS